MVLAALLYQRLPLDKAFVNLLKKRTFLSLFRKIFHVQLAFCFKLFSKENGAQLITKAIFMICYLGSS